MLRLFAIVFVLVLVAACGKQEKQVVFIFKEPVRQTKLNVTKDSYLQGGPNTVSLVNAKGVMVHMAYANHNDTLMVTTLNDYVEISHRYHALEMAYFYVKAGDTIDVTYDPFGYPVLISRTSDDLTASYNLLNKRDRADSFGFNPLTLAGSRKVFTHDELGITPEAWDSLFVKAKDYIGELRARLEGYKQSSTVDKHYVDYYTYLTDLMDVRLAYYESLDKGTPIDSVKLYAFFDDSRVDYVSYRLLVSSLLNLYARDYYIEHVENGRSVRTYDYRIIFNSLEQGKLPKRTFHLFKFFCLDNIVKAYPQEAYLYYEKYLSVTDDFLKDKKPSSLW